MILERLENGFSKVLPNWAGSTVVLIAGGPSLTPKQVEQTTWLRRIYTIAVNDAYLLAPWADVCYFADSHWWQWHSNGIEKPSLGLSAEAVRQRFRSFAGQKCTIQNSGANVKDPAVHMLRNIHYPNHGLGLSLDPQALCTGRNSGFQVLNLAILAGAKRIILLGYDGAPAADGRTHWFGDHPRPMPPAVYPYFVGAFSAAEKAIADAGVQVVNCSPGSRINSFSHMDLMDALEMFHVEHNVEGGR